MTAALALIATEEYTERRDALRAASRSGRKPASQCEEMARCWLAIAVSVGARPPEAAGFAHADHIAPPAQRQAELVRARDAAVRKAMAHPTDRALAMRSLGLSSLALHLGAPIARVEPRSQEAPRSSSGAVARKETGSSSAAIAREGKGSSSEAVARKEAIA